MAALELQAAVERTSLGLALVAGSAAGICAVLLGEDAAGLERDLRRRFPGAVLAAAGASFRELVVEVVRQLAAPAPACTVPLDLRGTAFQRAVWRELLSVPAGATVSYAELAGRLGRPGAARAVGQAVAANPIAVLVPCHRAIRSDGSLAGYRWGAERKRLLLAREAAGASRA